MSSVNRQSLREERDRLEADFSQLAAAGKLNAETDALIRSLLLLLKLLIAVFLERNTVKTRANSGLPPSRSPKDDTTPGQPGRQGKGKALDRTQADNTRAVETVAISALACCDHCGEDLRRVRCQGHERRTRVDIVFEKVIEHVDAEIKKCPHCRELSRAPFPTAYAGPIQYGTGVKAYALNLLMMQMVALKRTQQLIQTLVGQLIAESTLLKYVMQLHGAPERWEREAIDTLLTLPALHVDETSLRADRQNHWIHFCSGGEITLKFRHRKRGVEAIEAIGLIPRYRGVLIHDCLAAYLTYLQCRHGLCGAHLLRELTAILRQGRDELPAIPPRPNGQRGRIASTDAHNLHDRFVRHKKAILLFASDPNVPFTNNRAERNLRMSKVKQKVAGCFRSRDPRRHSDESAG